MFSSQKFAVTTAAGGGTDDNFENVTLLLNGDGTNGAQNNTFVDSSTNNFTITRNGNTTQGSFSPYGSLWSNYFNGSSYLTTSSSVGATSVTTTVEYWAYSTVNSNSSTAILGQNGTDFSIGVENDKPTAWLNTTLTIVSGFTNTIDGGSDNRAVKGTTSVSLNAWHHYAWVFSVGGSTTTCTLYVDGSSYGSFTFSNVGRTIGAIGAFAPGAGYARYFNGYISNVRVTNSAVYTGTFTPSTTPLTAISGTQLLTCQSNRFIDNSSNAYTISIAGGTPSVQRFSPFNPTASYDTATIGGSGYFDGSGDYLTLANNSAWDLGSNNFTVEAWCYPTASGSNVVITRAADGSTYPTFELTIYGGTWRFYSSSSSSAYNVQLNSNVAAKLNEWQHVAVTRNGSTYTIWINGVSANTATSSASLYANSNVVGIGAYPDNTNRFYGYLSDVRLVNGTAVYSSTFTPSTAPLTAVTNTQLLCKMTNAGITDSAMMNDLETVGNAQVSTSVKKFGTGSLAFDGTGDYLVTISKPITETGTGDFTIEGWAYIEAFGDPRPIFCLGDSDLSSGLELYVNTSSAALIRSGGTTRVNGGANSLTSGSWKHFAVVRNSGSVYLYVDGVAKGTAWASTTNFTGNMYIGCDFQTAVTYMFYGYIDDFRFTKGYARYTANFTPPTAALPVK